MYRQPAGSPPRVDRPLIVPGVGVGSAVVGRSTAEEVLAWFGSDCKVSRYDPSGDIFDIDYDYASDNDYAPGRPVQTSRPAGFAFEFGLLKAIEVGVYQSELVSPEGLRIGSTRADVLALLGQPSAVLVEAAGDTLRFVHLGVQLDVARDDDTVVGMKIFRPRW